MSEDYDNPYSDITLSDLIALLGSYVISAEKLGDCDLSRSVLDVVHGIEHRSFIRVKHEEMAAILYHVKNMVMEKVSNKEMIPTYEEYVALTQRLHKLNKKTMKLNEVTGEYEFNLPNTDA